MSRLAFVAAGIAIVIFAEGGPSRHLFAATLPFDVASNDPAELVGTIASVKVFDAPSEVTDNNTYRSHTPDKTALKASQGMSLIQPFQGAALRAGICCGIAWAELSQRCRV